MSNWQKDLKKKAEELNIKEEKNDVSVKTDSSLRSGSSSRWRRNVNLSNLRKEKVNKVYRKEETVKMIPSKGLFEDYNAIDKEQISAAEKVWKYIPKLIKIILNCRTNTVKIMDKLEIPRESIDRKKEQKPAAEK